MNRGEQSSDVEYTQDGESDEEETHLVKKEEEEEDAPFHDASEEGEQDDIQQDGESRGPDPSDPAVMSQQGDNK